MTERRASDAAADEHDECCPPIRTYEIKTSREDQCCDEMYRHVLADDLPVTYLDIDRSWSIAYQDGGSSTLEIRFCPWCGTKLPPDLWEQREQRLTELGLEDAEPNDPRIPQRFRSDRWWKDAGL